jgi:IS5 family transposase
MIAELILWDALEDKYAWQFSKGCRAPAKPARMTLGALIINPTHRRGFVIFCE